VRGGSFSAHNAKLQQAVTGTEHFKVVHYRGLVRQSERICVPRGGRLDTQALLVEVLLSGFFAIACFRARAETPSTTGLAPQRLFVLTDRLERLSRSRWQWFAMVLLLFVMRKQMGTPMVAELTALVQFLVFLALPTLKQAPGTSPSR
jgi:hypothetical protein